MGVVSGELGFFANILHLPGCVYVSVCLYLCSPCCPALMGTWSGSGRRFLRCSLSVRTPLLPAMHCASAPEGYGTNNKQGKSTHWNLWSKIHVYSCRYKSDTSLLAFFLWLHTRYKELKFYLNWAKTISLIWSFWTFFSLTQLMVVTYCTVHTDR